MLRFYRTRTTRVRTCSTRFNATHVLIRNICTTNYCSVDIMRTYSRTCVCVEFRTVHLHRVLSVLRYNISPWKRTFFLNFFLVTLNIIIYS